MSIADGSPLTFRTEALISGDRIEIYTADGSELELVDGHNFPDGMWHCHIDDAGGVRLYTEFEDAINGGFDKALVLVKPSATKQILVRTRDSRFQCLAQMQQWDNDHQSLQCRTRQCWVRSLSASTREA